MNEAGFTTGEHLLINFEVTSKSRKSKRRMPKIIVFKSREEVRTMIEQDHLTESARHRI